jgi:uncharacterized protein YaaW (UPF0174 family)
MNKQEIYNVIENLKMVANNIETMIRFEAKTFIKALDAPFLKLLEAQVNCLRKQAKILFDEIQ